MADPSGGVDHQQYQASAFMGAIHVLHNSADAEDVAQDAVIKQLENKTDAKYARVYGRRHALNRAKQTTRRRDKLSCLLPPTSLTVLPPDARAQLKEEFSLLDGALTRLSVKYRMVIELRWFSDVPFAEVARQLGIAEETARSRECRARKLLKTYLGPGSQFF